jgi:hypothetical protein
VNDVFTILKERSSFDRNFVSVFYKHLLTGKPTLGNNYKSKPPLKDVKEKDTVWKQSNPGN